MSEKTEQPTSKRLRDAREKGDIAKSQEIPSAAIVLAVIAYFIVNSDSVFTKLIDCCNYTFTTATSIPYDKALPLIGAVVVDTSVAIVSPLVAIAILVSFVSMIFQTGFLVAPKGAMPKMENLSPSRWFKQVFSMRNAFDFVKNILKVLVLCFAVYSSSKNNIAEVFKIPQSDIGAAWTLSAALLKDLALYSVGAFAFIAVLDFLYVKYKYTKDHMMSPQEVKQEYKEMEGDPYIKQKRKQLHMEMANMSAVANTRKAKVLVVNPTHYAVAIDYVKGVTPLPIIVAKGQGDLARRMIEAAREENIPIMRQPALARALFAQGDEDQFVPDDLLVPVAEILKIIAAVEKR